MIIAERFPTTLLHAFIKSLYESCDSKLGGIKSVLSQNAVKKLSQI